MQVRNFSLLFLLFVFVLSSKQENVYSGPSVDELAHHPECSTSFFESKNNVTDPVVLWLTGGLGCSGSLALFTENGPFAISENLSSLGTRMISNVIYVDQTVGTGFSNMSDTSLLQDWMINLEVNIPALVEDGINLLIYAGEYDFICNWLGNSRWVEQMNWSGQKEFGSAKTVPFLVDGKEAGFVHDARHMVPMDQPKASWQMLKTWIHGQLATPPNALVRQ
ncbi:hypothetical protein Bca52824_004677 [Brassica carinata]|uniref:Uncharacterized protein n=1 Tax=Brassica carinata TaxID=52824 RepID=A0A8X7WQ75_BRACI|nr:hypothetical protein Bca52824_004677 [Brassica carinata]